MKFRIYFEHADGTQDFFIVEGNTVEEIRRKAEQGVTQRNGNNPWSEEVQG